MIDSSTTVVTEPEYQNVYYALYLLKDGKFCLTEELTLKDERISLLPGAVKGNWGTPPLNVVMGQDPRTAESLAVGYAVFARKIKKELERVPTVFAGARKTLETTIKVSEECSRVFAEERQITAESFSKAQQMSYN
jgi:hypothetical protein